MTRRGWRTSAEAAVAGALAFLLYFATLAPGLYWGDIAQLQTLTARPEIALDARAYPLWVLVSAGVRAITGLDPCLAANLVSALFGAAAVAAAYAVTKGLGAGRTGAAFGAAALAVSHLLWSASTVAEVYSAAALLLLLSLLAADRARALSARAAFLFGLMTGISVFHHRLVQLAAFAVFVPLAAGWARERRLLGLGAWTGLGFLAAALPIGAVLVAFGTTAEGVAGIRNFLFGTFATSLPEGLGLGRGALGLILYEARFLAFNLAGIQILLLVPGLRAAGGRRGLLLGLGAAGLFAPLLFPHLGDRYVLLLPAVCAGAVLSGLGADAVLRRFSSRCLPFLAVLLAAATPPAVYGFLAARPDRLPLFAGAAPEHARAFLWPGKAGNREAEEFGRQVLSAVPPRAVIFTGWGDGAVLRHLQVVRGVRADVRSSLPGDRNRGLALPRPGHRVYASAYPWLPLAIAPARGYALVPVIPGRLWELVPRPGSPEGDR